MYAFIDVRWYSTRRWPSTSVRAIRARSIHEVKVQVQAFAFGFRRLSLWIESVEPEQTFRTESDLFRDERRMFFCQNRTTNCRNRNEFGRGRR